MKKIYLILFALFAFCVCKPTAQAAEPIGYPPPELKFPVSCSLNENCWILNSNEYGTDIAVKHWDKDSNGASVLSAQDGTVVTVKNDPLNKSFYGNTVIIAHSNGWKTVYTNLKQNSITVSQGDFAGVGTKIAEIGDSGSAAFPHLSFVVLKDNKSFLPPWDPLIKDSMQVQGFVIANKGAAAKTPAIDEARSGKLDNSELLNNISSIYLWAYGFNFKKGDFLKFTLLNPDSKKIFNNVIEIKEDSNENFYTAQVQNETQTWQTGNYTAKVEFIRPETGIANEYVFSFNIKEPEKPVDEEKLKQQEVEKKLEEQRALQRKRIFMYKKLYDEGKLPDTVPDNVKERLKGN